MSFKGRFFKDSETNKDTVRHFPKSKISIDNCGCLSFPLGQ